MDTIVFFSIVITCVLYISFPFFEKRIFSRSKSVFKDDHLGDLYAERDNLLTTIKDLEFDHEMGKMSNQDFAEMSSQYRGLAIDVLKDIDFSERDDGGKQRHENQFNERHLQEKERGMVFCTKCGVGCDIKDHFCSQCGQRLHPISR